MMKEVATIWWWIIVSIVVGVANIVSLADLSVSMDYGRMHKYNYVEIGLLIIEFIIFTIYVWFV